jgi:aminoglycoside phosphotransferase (APT) family kinase protein
VVVHTLASGDVGQPPDGRALSRVCAAAVPGSEVLSVTGLTGGLSTHTDAVRLRLADGRRVSVVLRRFVTGDEPAARVATEHAALRAARRSALPVPEPLWLDATGRTFGVPALLESFLPGRPSVATATAPGGIRAMAEVLAALHAAHPPGTRRIPHASGWIDRSRPPDPPPAWQAYDAGPAAWALAVRTLPRVLDDPTVLTHGDLHLGNVLWHRGRLAGIIDWENAQVAPAVSDVAYLRLDLCLAAGQHTADAFLRAYEAVAGPVARLPVWDIVAASRAFSEYRAWTAVYRENGQHRLAVATVRRRLERFLTAAVAAGDPGRPLCLR